MAYMQANGVKLYYEINGPEVGQPLLLIHGLNTPMKAWPLQFIDTLVSNGFRVIQFDNRDVGRSENMDRMGGARLPLIMAGQKIGLNPKPRYSLNDMAVDALALLDQLGIKKASVVGASMGAMIAQHLAANAPDRILSMCALMSSSGAPNLPNARRHILKLLYSAPSEENVEKSLNHSCEMWQAIGSTTYPLSETELPQFVAGIRNWGPINPQGGARHLAAVLTDKKRYTKLMQIKTPTLVIHGLQDPLVPAACGQDLASRIKGAKLVLLPDMGHDLPVQLLPRITEEIINHALYSSTKSVLDIAS